VLPGFIVFSEIGSGSTASLKFTVSTVNNSDVGTYKILVTATFAMSPSPAVSQTSTFTLKVTPAPTPVVIPQDVCLPT
jgi:hypothetical protein